MKDQGCGVSFSKSGANVGVYEVIIDGSRLECETSKEAESFDFGGRHFQTKLEKEVGRLLLGEVAKGIVTPDTKAFFKRTAEELIKDGADCLILGSTDLGFVLEDGDVDVPMFSTAVSHARGVAEWALKV